MFYICGGSSRGSIIGLNASVILLSLRLLAFNSSLHFQSTFLHPYIVRQPLKLF